MPIIYEPSGKAREYSELATNLYTGCLHKCKYCYCPAIMRKSLDQWSECPQPRKNILHLFENDAKKLQGLDKELLFSFMSDPYQNDEAAKLTREALLICQKYGFKKVNVLTKAGKRIDFDLLKANNWKFGSTIIFKSEALREEWEPGATTIQDRYDAVKKAHELGIYTWVSIEPVIDPKEALEVIKDLKPFVNFWKVGKINHFKEIEEKIDWSKFLKDAEQELSGCEYYIKKDLEKYRK